MKPAKILHNAKDSVRTALKKTAERPDFDKYPTLKCRFVFFKRELKLLALLHLCILVVLVVLVPRFSQIA